MTILVVLIWIVLIGCFAMSRDPKYNPTLRDWRESWRERSDAWSAMVADGALLEDLTYFIRDPANYEKVWAEVSDAYSQIPLHQNRKTILLHTNMVTGDYTAKEKREIVQSYRSDALNIMMARRGKAQPICAAHLGRGIGEHSKRFWDETFYLWIYIQEELKQHGIPAELIFIYEDYTREGHRIERAYPIDHVESFRYRPGRLEWLQESFYRYDENGLLVRWN